MTFVFTITNWKIGYVVITPIKNNALLNFFENNNNNNNDNIICNSTLPLIQNHRFRISKFSRNKTYIYYQNKKKIQNNTIFGFWQHFCKKNIYLIIYKCPRFITAIRLFCNCNFHTIRILKYVPIYIFYRTNDVSIFNGWFKKFHLIKIVWKCI